MKISLEPILPKKNIFDPARYKAEIDKATLTAKDGIQADYKKTVATWNHKPKFYTTRRGYNWYIGTTRRDIAFLSNWLQAKKPRRLYRQLCRETGQQGSDVYESGSSSWNKGPQL